MTNTLTLSVPTVNTLISQGWTGIEVWKASSSAGSYSLLVQVPFVASQTTYTYIDSVGLATDWYKDRYYAPAAVYGGYSSPWSVTVMGGPFNTLAQIEQETAPRLGPYYLRTQSSTLHATTALAYFDELKSSANPGGVENLYMLRRGQKSDGTTVTVAAADRQRIAATCDPLTGAVAPDRIWGVVPADGELIEFHHLDPALELRPAVLSGLKRCYFEDRATITLTTAATERDLTALVPWIMRPDQVRRYQFTTTGATILPEDVSWAQPFEKGGHVWLQAWPDQYPNTLLITGLRSHFTWVNASDSTTGPTADGDLLTVDLGYAASAAHIEAWRLFKARLKAAADAGFQASQQEAAAEFTRNVIVQKRRRRTGWNLSGPFGESRLSVRAR